jgi:hypothetical protein
MKHNRDFNLINSAESRPENSVLATFFCEQLAGILVLNAMDCGIGVCHV